MRKHERELRKLAKRFRLQVDLGPGGHFIFRTQAGKFVQSASASPSDNRAIKNIERMLKASLGGQR